MAFDTASNVINDALIELKLVSAAVSDVYASTDANVVLLRYLLKAIGRDLVREHEWSHLQEQHSFSTVNGTETYALPAGFHRLLNQTGWNRTQQEPLGGPVAAQGWQLLKAVTATGIERYFRVVGNEVALHPTPTAAETVAYEYLSEYWVQPTGQTVPTAATPTANTDTLWFDPHLLVRALKWRWLAEKGLPSEAAWADYQSALEKAKSADGAAPVLRAHGGLGWQFRYLGEDNLPENGYG